MTRLTTLLALTDLSAPSRHAVARAAMVAGETGARLELLHVLQRDTLDQLRALLGQDTTAVATRVVDETRAELAQLAAAACEARGISPGVHLATGTPLSEITRQADGCDADLIVLGAHGAGFMRHLLLGSTAERLLRKTLRPMLMVRQVPHETYRRLLVPVDFSPWSIAAIRLARAIAPSAKLILYNAYDVPYEGKLRIAGVAEEQILHYRNSARQDAERSLEAMAAQAGLAIADYRCVVTRGDAGSQILEQEQEQDVDLIVIGKHGKGMTEELLLGSTTKYVLAQSNCDVLVTQRA